MKKIFWGFLLIFLNFHLTFNQHSLNILPDFAGYILLLRGARELEGDSEFFRNVRPFAAGMAVYTAILWVGALLGATSADSWLTLLLEFIAEVVSLYIAWVLIQGILKIETQREAVLNGGTLYQWWKGLAAVQIAAWLLKLLDNLANKTALLMAVMALAAVGVVLIVLYLIAWWKAVKAWEALPPQEADAEKNE